MAHEEMKNWALKYASMGLAVFPLKAHDKVPLTKNGCKDASTDPSIIEGWWNKYPNANIGITTGRKSNGLFAIDLDVDEEKGINGYTVLSDWEKANGPLPETAQSITGRGGYHLLYRDCTNIKNAVGIYDGVDIRGEGGYIVAPPSVHPNGNEYVWEHDLEEFLIADANDAVFNFILPPRKQEKEQFNGSGDILQGSRTSSLIKAIASMKGKSFPNSAIEAAIREMNATQCNPPLTDKELEREVLPAIHNLKNGDPKYSVMKNDMSKAHSTELISMNDIPEEEMEWLIPDFIPKGVINLLAGDGGVGKTTTWCNVLASVSSGRPCFFEENSLFGEIEREPKKVIFFSSEDDPRYSLKKRLRLNGANMENVLTVPISDERFKDIKFNSEFLEKLIIEHEPALIVFDPLQSFIPSDVNMGYRNNMRAMLNPMIGYGEKYGVTTLIMVHTNKRENAHGRNRISDSSDIWDIARNVFILGRTEEENVRYMSHEKINNAKEQDTTLFTIEDGIPVFKETTTKKDRDYMSAKSYQRKDKGAKDEAEEAILEYLQDGEKETADLDAYLKSLSIGITSLKKAKTELRKKGLINYRSIGKGKDKKFFTYLVLEEIPLDTL